MLKVIIYTTPSCVYCKEVREFFKENNVEYEEKDVAEDEAAREKMIEKSGQLGVPVIDIGGNIVIGFDEKKLQEFLEIK